MNSSSFIRRHWIRVLLHFGSDWVIWSAAFFAALCIRFSLSWKQLSQAFADYSVVILLAGGVFSCASYIFGLYGHKSPRPPHVFLIKRSVVLAVCLGLALCFLVVSGYLNFSTRIGRGAMLIGAALAYAAIWLRHDLLGRWLVHSRERVVFVVSRSLDEEEILLNRDILLQNFEVLGLVAYGGYQPSKELPNLGSVEDLLEITARHRVDRVVVSDVCLENRELYPVFCQMRYSGLHVISLITLCEELFHNVPLELVTTEWLLSTSGEARVFYIRKLKRAFDILASLVGLVLAFPILLAAAMAIKLTSKGPIFYRQIRSGLFGRSFLMNKLRTMRVDAEKHGAVWSASSKDPRSTPVGHFMRKYRIDEIPQLWNVLKGEMSLVGPRPERPEFVNRLAETIPFYRERLMIQPGITGWAQVSYPYGACEEDARRKLEFDLYYLKHMSLFLDCLILLDTIRTILVGGLGESHKTSMPRYAANPRRMAVVHREIQRPTVTLSNP